MSNTENMLTMSNNVLLCIEAENNLNPVQKEELSRIQNTFYGISFTDLDKFSTYALGTSTVVYLCGYIGHIMENIKFPHGTKVNVVQEYSYSYSVTDPYEFVKVGMIPLNVNNMGVYFRDFFDPSKDHFNTIQSAHTFQTLTESNKPSNAFRTGVYMTRVDETEDKSEVKFNLLRCSSNFDGPTNNFSEIDNDILSRVNSVAESSFTEKSELNHVLAQLYTNTRKEGVDKKAKIREHSDKTKDMPRNGLMAFCTFYDGFNGNSFNIDQVGRSNHDMFDHVYKKTSVLTRMRFKLKSDVNDTTLIKKFDITLYPNSVFIMGLGSNRLYTHEIIPSTLSVNNIPTRLGYVIRCSNTTASFKNNQTYIVRNGEYVKLEEPDTEGVEKLKKTYSEENRVSNLITYDNFDFSLNRGDYERPLC